MLKLDIYGVSGMKRNTLTMTLFKNKYGRRATAWLMLMLCGGACGVWSSCTVEGHMKEKTAELLVKMQKVPHWDKLPQKTVTWDEAVKLMMAGNFDLKNSERALRTAERSVTDVFTKFIPGVNLDWLMTKELSELTNVGGDDLEYHTNILFSKPSLTQNPYDYNTAKASVYTAQKTLEMKKRELISRLYRQVMTYRNAKVNYANQLKTLPIDADESRKLKMAEEHRRTVDKISQEFAALFGNMHARWLVEPDSMPRLDWGKYKAASKNLDLLVVTMVAMELEASRLQVLDAKTKFFPSVEINFYSPSLFTSTGGTYGGFFAGAGDMKVNMSLTEELDTRLTSWFQYRNAKESHEIMKRQVIIELQQRRIKVAELMESRQEFEAWRKYALNKIKFEEERVPTNADEYLEQRRSLEKIYSELDAEGIKNTDVEAALIMEYGWLK